MPQTEGLLNKTGVLREKVASSSDEVLGFDYMTRHGDTCHEYYAANPPLIGMTRPTEIPCPLGARVIGEYKIDYNQAIRIFLESNCGDAFTAISLSWPLVASVTEPQWHILSITGSIFVVGANSGDGQCMQAHS